MSLQRKLSVGDKMAGRHGNKGVVAKIVPEEDMPFLKDGTPVDICLNPLGVPSRMNVGQLLETHLGWASKMLGLHYATPIFDGISEKSVHEYLQQAMDQNHNRWAIRWWAKTARPISMTAKLRTLLSGDRGRLHLHAETGSLSGRYIHARAVGPYSLVTQQPLGGKAQYGGQRFRNGGGAMEAYGAAYTLQELLTVKSDDVQGRTRIYENIVKGDNTLDAGIPESFNVLVKEMESLGLEVKATPIPRGTARSR